MERYASRAGLSALCLSAVCLSPISSAQAVVISELLYDASGGDAGNVFVELFGAAGEVLDGWSLRAVNGGDGSVYRTVELSGSIPADGVFVIVDSASSSIPNGDLVASVDFQNGPDSVQLYNGDLLIDALGYGDFTGLFFAGEGDAAPDVPGGSSLARSNPFNDTDNNLADFVELVSPTPGSVPGGAEPIATVPLPASAWLLGSGLALLSRRRLSGG